MKQKPIAYLYWCTIFVGLAGIHRIYCGKYATGIIWLFTGGLLGVGQLFDLIAIPGMVNKRNLKYATLHHAYISKNQTVVLNLGDHLAPSVTRPQLENSKNDIQTILEFANSNNNIASLSDCVIATGKPAKEVKEVLATLCSNGWMEVVENHPKSKSGIVVYRLSCRAISFYF